MLQQIYCRFVLGFWYPAFHMVNIKDIIAIHSLGEVIINKINTELETLKSAHLNEWKYVEVLNKYYELCIKNLYEKFSMEMMVFKSMDGVSKTLDFSLNQDELVSLLFIIRSAGFFNYSQDTPFLKFALDHFCYVDKQGKKARPTVYNNFSKKYSDISGTQAKIKDTHETSLHKVGKRLKNVIDKLR
jgi:hypothetical protein